MTNPRAKLAARYFITHLAICAIAASAAAAFVFFFLYPYPFSRILGVSTVFTLIVGVDVVLGPMVTAILANPRKTTRERNIDFFLVGIIQLIALAYGMHAIWTARPAALVFENDRFVLIRANEIFLEGDNAQNKTFVIPTIGVLKVGITDSPTDEELIKSVSLAGQGITAAMRPLRWQPISASEAQIKKAAKRIELLDSKMREESLARKLPKDGRYYIPLTTSRTYDWIALLNEQYRTIDYIQLDGF